MASKIINTRANKLMYCIAQENHAKAIAFLTKKPRTAKDLCEHTKLTQPAIYIMLKRFVELGVVSAQVPQCVKLSVGLNHTHIHSIPIYSVIRQYANEMLLKQPDEVKVVQFKHWRKVA